MRTRASRYPSWPGVNDSTKGRIHWRRPTAIVRFSLATLRQTIHSDKTGGLNASMQHLLEVFLEESTKLISFASLDSNGTMPCLGSD